MGLQIYSSKSNAWRDQYNPLRGMNLPRLMSLLDAGERGQYADLQWFYHYMERSDAMVFSVMQRRRAALLACDWDIRTVSGRDEVGNLKPEERGSEPQTAKGADKQAGKFTTKNTKKYEILYYSPRRARRDTKIILLNLFF